MAASERRLVFHHTVEGLLAAHREALTTEVRTQLTQLGCDPDSVPAAIDAEVYGKVFACLRAAAWPTLSETDAGMRMGERFMSAYFATTLGGLVGVLLKVLSVEKAVQRVPQSLMSGANFIKATVEKRGERHFHIVMSDYSTSPSFLCGVVSEMVRRAGSTPTTRVIREEGRAITIELTWV